VQPGVLYFQAGLWIRIGSGFSDFVDPDPYWESRSGSRGKKMKKFQWKNALFSYLKKIILPLKRCKIALTTFWWITPVFLIWFDSKFDFKEIWEGNCLQKFFFSSDPDPEPDSELDPDSDWTKMLDPDPVPY
jgi:hypothetical protein